MKKIHLSDGEWKLMNLLWDASPRTAPQLVDALKEDTGWTRSTIHMMLNRLAERGIVRFEESGRSKLYFSVLKREDAVAGATRNFLSRVYRGSVSMMVNTLVEQESLSTEEIDALYDILKKAEEKEKGG